MFLAHRTGQPARAVETEADAEGALWLDLISPTDAEHALATKIAGTSIPVRADLDEIESSSRLYTREHTVYLSTPLVSHTDTDLLCPPVGFVLTPTYLITVRFTTYPAFDNAARQIADSQVPVSSDDMLTALLESVVDCLADVLEHLGLALNQLSRDVFAGYTPRAGRIATWQRSILRRVGHAEEFATLIRDSLLGLQRISSFVGETNRHTLPHTLVTRLGTVCRDLSSLTDFVSQLSGKIQFLLDAALGFISIEQNDGMKILTVVTFVGMPPTLIAGIYGMNFKDIPELNWSYGYLYALTLMAASVFLPILWFWRRGWLGGIK